MVCQPRPKENKRFQHPSVLCLLRPAGAGWVAPVACLGGTLGFRLVLPQPGKRPWPRGYDLGSALHRWVVASSPPHEASSASSLTPNPPPPAPPGAYPGLPREASSQGLWWPLCQGNPQQRQGVVMEEGAWAGSFPPSHLLNPHTLTLHAPPTVRWGRAPEPGCLRGAQGCLWVEELGEPRLVGQSPDC